MTDVRQSGEEAATQDVILGRYRLIEELGRGAMGVVYKAKDPVLNRVVAIKTMAAEAAENEELITRLGREGEAAAKLKHPNIITVYDIGEEDSVPFIAMEYLDGVDLKQILRNKIRLYPSEVLGILRQIGLGLRHAHKAGVVHRDVKPANIRIIKDGTVKIMDFGIAQLASSQLTRAGTVMGSVDYMSPEQVEGRRVDQRCDIFAFGVLAFELLTSRNPFKGPNMSATMHNILRSAPPPLESEALEVYPDLETVLLRCLDKDQETRYQSMAQVIEGLDGLETLDKGKGRAQVIKPPSALTQLASVADPGGDDETVFTTSSKEGPKSAGLWVNPDRFSAVRDTVKNREKARPRKPLRVGNTGRLSGSSALSTQRQTRALAPKSRWPFLAAGAVAVIAVIVLIYVMGLSGEGGSVDAANLQQFISQRLAAAGEKQTVSDFRGAEQELNRILEVAPNHEQASLALTENQRLITQAVDQHLQSAQAHIEQENFAEAKKELESLLRIQSDHEEAQTLLRAASTELGARNAETEKRRRFAELLSIGREQLQAGQVDAASQSLAEAQELDPVNEEVRQLLGRIEARSARTSQAAAAYRRGVQALSGGEYERAVSELERTLNLDPNHRQAKQKLVEARAEAARPRFGALTVNALPFGEVILDGKKIGTTPVRLDEVPTGSHKIQVVRDGFKVYQRELVIEEGKTSNVVAELEKEP